MGSALKGRGAASLLLLVASALLIAACGGSSKKKPSTSKTTSASAGWTLPNGNLQNTRDVPSQINASNVSKLGVAWTVPIKATGTFGGYAATPVIVNGVLYTQDLDSNVEAIKLSTGKVLWTHVYNSPNEGPDGVTVGNGTVYAATATSVVALQAATGEQLWSRKLIRNTNEGIDMAPGYYKGTLYVSTVPGNAYKGFYLGNGEATLWALNATSGTPDWKWDEVGDLWSHGNKKLQDINSGGGQWEPPSIDSQGNIYIGVSNPAPLGGTPQYPWGTSRPGPDLYTDSIVKLSPQGKLLWYYQLTPHDLFDWDMNNTPMLTTVNGQPAAIDGGKAGIMVAVSAQTGKVLWKLPVGVHKTPANDSLVTEYSSPKQAFHSKLGKTILSEPGEFGGVESQPATNGSTVFAAVNNLALPMPDTGSAATSKESAAQAAKALKALAAATSKGTGDMVAINQNTGKLIWDDHLSSSPYGAATVTNNVVFTTTYNGHLEAFNAATGAVLLNTPLSAATNAPVMVDGPYVITAAGYAQSKSQVPLIIAYKLGAKGTLPYTMP
jgi:outer membrane protein assembly factor BamB